MSIDTRRKEVYAFCALDSSDTGLSQLTIFCEHGADLLGT